MSAHAVEPKITLFDIPSICKPQAWSGNTWKARYILNYKRIPYKTVWIPYPDIEKTLVNLGGEGKATSKRADDPTKPLYTLPAILDETGTEAVLIVDSVNIAEYLDQKYPERPVMPNVGKALEFAVEALFTSTVWPLAVMPLLPFADQIQDERSQPYFRESRERVFKKKIEEFSPEGPIRDSQWKALQEGLDKFAAVLDKNGPNIYFVRGGINPTFADFLLAARIRWIKTIAPEEWRKRGVEQWSNGRWGKLLKSLEPWESPAE
ncbi:hypothetical protein M422DRAFT_210415 [Sphaerobolus stellatus SS14]|uniref:GST N-terminal domain-containing protein n=1 Tax=Sphaerobolus stellatus (strain SS14) TaxID=990650 RepID=A0A0C9VN97_SPHS4|nr:hypothetical protein M422DRAFT_210415 [Sphaerobolus stellatus SS14]